MNKLAIDQRILIIDDDRVFNDLMVQQLKMQGYTVDGVRSMDDADNYLQKHEPDLIMLDIRLPDCDGLNRLPGLARQIPVVVLTAYGSVKNAVKAMRLGAVEYLVKPVNLEELELSVQRALGNAEMRRDIQFVRRREQEGRKSFMVGSSEALKKVTSLINAVAGEDMTVLITGESGTGKELVAREIHERSQRKTRNFVALDCCTLQENLFESELFGHERGAFTGADRQKKGLIEGAKGGTLFLDEIGEIGPPIQAKLLRGLETGEFRRLGGTQDLTSNARVLAATNRDLEAMSQEGAFRQDLFYRLGAFVIAVPPLRHRREDIPALVDHFLNHHDFSRRISKKLTRSALLRLTGYDWPGNVRELRNVIERAIIISGDDKTIHAEDLGLTPDRGSSSKHIMLSFDHEPTLEEIKKSYIRDLLHKYAGHRSKLATILGISERNIYRLIKKYDLGND
jgi:two-component system NtrC family response regulator